MSYEPQLERLVRFYETIDAHSLRAQLATIYSDEARFKDPFNEVQGLDAIAAIFEHMFEQVHAPRFVVVNRVQEGAQAFLVWEFQYRMKRFSQEQQCIRGASHIVFDARGKVFVHRDYWDAAEELYEKLPLLGALMRWLKRRATV